MVNERFFRNGFQVGTKFLHRTGHGKVATTVFVFINKMSESQVVIDKTLQILLECFRILIDKRALQFIGFFGILRV